MTPQRADSKVALITGANKGIGLEITRQLGRRGMSAGRIVNMSSSLGSLTLTNNPHWTFAHINLLAHNSSKTALNAVTVQFAKELQHTPIKVNPADPAYTATDLNHHTGTRRVEQGAWAAVGLATLSADGPSGGFFDEDGTPP